jgi:hypothetical protein
MVTYSPNEKRISGDECAGSTAVKPQYHDYVIDLANFLGARFDTNKSKSKLLGLKYALRNKAQSIEPLKTSEYSMDEYFQFTINGQTYYTDGYTVVSDDDVKRVQQMDQQGELKLSYPQKDTFKTVLVQANRGYLASIGVNFIPLRDFSEE